MKQPPSFRKFAILFLLIFACVNISAQNERVSLHLTNVTLKQVFKSIEKQTSCRFSYRNVMVDRDKDVTIKNKNVTVKSVLDEILPSRNLAYTMSEKSIVIYEKPHVRESPTSSAPKTNVIGRVTDSKGEPIIGATIREDGNEANATVTDIDGNFSLNVKPDAMLSVSYIGYLSQVVKAKFGKPLSINLKDDTESLNEVIVIGYGTAKRKDFTGSVSSMKLEDSPVADVQNTNALEAVKGSITGLNVGYSNAAGSSPVIEIRGQNSISGSNTPLIVVDGIIFTGSMNDINPDDIATYDVLKDASSSAVYGSRSANGVICINTKKGKLGKPMFSFNFNEGPQMWSCKPDMMSPNQWLEATKARNNYTDNSFLVGQVADNFAKGKSTDWMDLCTRTGWLQNYHGAVSGATEKYHYYMSAAYSKNKGIVVGDDYKRITLTGKMDADINSWFSMGADASYSRSDYSGIGANLFAALLVNPYSMPYRKGDENLLEKYPNGNNTAVNPLWGVNDGTQDNYDVQNAFRLNGYAEVKCPFIKGLSYRMNYSTNLTLANQNNFYHESYYTYLGAYDDADRYSSSTQHNYLASANGNDAYSRTSSWVLDNILSFSRNFGLHQVDVTAVATRDRTNYKWHEMTGTDYSSIGNTLLGADGLAYASVQKIYKNATRTTNIGYVLRGSYNFADKYYFTGTYRRDGASVFGANKKWGNFGAIGLAWRLTNESFMKNFKELNDFKLKLSYGRNGNQGISAYSTLSTVAAGQSGGYLLTFGNTGNVTYGINKLSLGNPNLGWETTEAWNLGFESSWFNNRIQLDVDAYVSNTFDELFTRTIPVMTGFGSMLSSMGKVRNTGFEITLRTKNVDTNNFKWNSMLTFWLNRDKLIHLYGDDMNGDGKEDDDVANGLFIGKSIHSIYGVKQIGIVQGSDADYIKANGVKAGTPKYEDHDHDGVITVNDRYVIGNTNPNFKLNFSNTFDYKNFELYFMLSGTFGGNGYYQKSNKPAYVIGGNGDYFGINGIYVHYWTTENKSNTCPAATFTGDSYYLGLQSRSFLRLQDISLSYIFCQSWMKSLGISSLKMFMSAKNILTLTGWDGGDPEIGNSITDGSYPVMKSISMGVNFSF